MRLIRFVNKEVKEATSQKGNTYKYVEVEGNKFFIPKSRTVGETVTLCIALDDNIKSFVLDEQKGEAF